MKASSFSISLCERGGEKKTEKKEKTPPNTQTGVFVLNNIPYVPSHYLFIHLAENITPTLVRSASSCKSEGRFTVFVFYFILVSCIVPSSVGQHQ